MTAATEANSGFLNLSAAEWAGERKAHLDAVPVDATVGEAVTEFVHALQLPFEDFYTLVFRGRELNHSDTLDEAGIANEDELELVPEVSAGTEG